jgi:hypothetical protein
MDEARNTDAACLKALIACWGGRCCVGQSIFALHKGVLSARSAGEARQSTPGLLSGTPWPDQKRK